MAMRSGAAAGMAAAMMAATAGGAAAKTVVYVSNALDAEIGVYELDAASGALAPMAKVPAGKTVMPMAVSADRRHLYAVVRSEPMRVLTYAIDPRSGALTQEGEAPLPASMPNVVADRSGRFLLTASYGGNQVAVSPIDGDGVVRRAAIQVVPTGQNAHAILADRSNRFVYATNLGSDQIVQFRFDPATGALSPNDPPAIAMRAGDGPRHLALSPDGRYLYAVHEMSGTVAQLAVDPDRGTLAQVDSIESVPPEAGMVKGVVQAPTPPTPKPVIWAADIQMTPDGRFLYTTERTGGTIAMFAVAPDTGKLAYAGSVPTVAQPRGIGIDPAGRFLVASGEKSDTVAVHRIDGSGRLAEVGRYPGGRGANWVEIVELP